MFGRVIGTAAATVAAGAVVLGGAQPAAASGNVVKNGGGERSVDIANCWNSSQNYHVGDTLPCATNGYSTNMPNAMWFLSKGQTSSSLGRYYLDTRAFRIAAGCVLTLTTGSSWNRVGKPALWIKTYMGQTTVATHRCP